MGSTGIAVPNEGLKNLKNCLGLVTAAESLSLVSVWSEGKTCICAATVLPICSVTEIKPTAGNDYYHRGSTNLLATFFVSFTLSFPPLQIFYQIVYGSFSYSAFECFVGRQFIVQENFIRKGRIVHCPLQQEFLGILGTHLNYKCLMSNLPSLPKMHGTSPAIYDNACYFLFHSYPYRTVQ